MISLKVTFVIFVLISGVIFTPSYSFAQSNQDENPLSSFFEILKQIFSFEDKQSIPNTEFRESTTIQTSGFSSTDPEENIVPNANAGPDQTVLEFATVTLDGSSSTDTNGDIKLFEWSQTDGPQVTLSSSTNVNPTFAAPDVDSNIVLIFNLKVTDNDGDMDDDNVKVTVKDTDNDNDKDNSDDKGNKVTICHRPPGNPNNSHTISIGEPAANAHLRHGDSLGECNDDKSNDENDKEENNDKNENSNNGNSSKDNPGKGNKDKDDDKKGNSNNGNSSKDNPGKGNKDKDDDKKGNSNNGNSSKDNPGKGNKDKDN